MAEKWKDNTKKWQQASEKWKNPLQKMKDKLDSGKSAIVKPTEAKILASAFNRVDSDNETFYRAGSDYKAEYEAKGIVTRIVQVYNGRDIVEEINNLSNDGKLKRLDLLGHASSQGLFFKEDINLGLDIRKVNLYSNKQVIQDVETAENLKISSPDAAVLSDINFAKFDYACRIEIHGCAAAGDVFGDGLDLFVKEFSILLFNAGKSAGVVIVHIGACKDISQYGYRHGTRVAYNNGKILSINGQYIYEEKGDIPDIVIKTALKQKYNIQE
ncbi:MAG: hypothetical protein IAE67_00100 [Candidatus Competibacteraceae bacterium]|nr:hypothetical protein [Candidatus Competibacteraceae bacterium]